MRQRKVKDLDRKLQAVSAFAVEEPSPAVWAQVFPAQRLAELSDQLRDPGVPAEEAAASRQLARQCPQNGTRPLYVEIGCGKGDFLLQQALAHPDCDFIGIEGQASVVLRAMEKAARIVSGVAAEDDPDWMVAAMQEYAVRKHQVAVGSAGAGATSDAVTAAARDAASTAVSVDGTMTSGAPATAAAQPATALPNIRFTCAFVNHMEDLFADGSLAGVYLNFSDPWPKGRHTKRRLTWRGRLQEYARALQPGGFIAFKTDNDDLFQFTLEEIAACGWTPQEMTWDLHGPDCTYEARAIQTEYEQKFRRAGRQIHYVRVVVSDGKTSTKMP